MSPGPIVIVGASVAGIRVAQALRRWGSDRPVVVLDAETDAPYDKPMLSKQALTDGTDPPVLLSATTATELRLDHRPGHVATGLDLDERVVHTSAGPVVFDDLVIATGSRPRRLTALEGAPGVHYLRTREDAIHLRSAFTRRPRVVIVGGGFIGGEVAASACVLGLEVEIIEAAPRILAHVFPVEVSSALAELHTAHGVTIHCSRTVRGHDTAGGAPGLVLDDGSVERADVVVVGIGTVPATGWLEGTGLVIDDGVVCGSDLQAEGARGVWAAGDVARRRDPRTGTTERAEHWTAAREQANVVGRNIALGAEGDRVHHHGVGYVWSDQYGVRIQHVGRTGSQVHEQPGEGSSRVFVYTQDGEVVGATGLDAPAEVLKLRRDLSAISMAPLSFDR